MYLCSHVNKTRPMELQCPQCGKWMAVSQEELLIHDSQVVCPQCLAVCRYINGALVVRDDSDAPYRHTASVDSTKQTRTKFCHSCGKKLPSGISFCPYCGADLSAPFEKSTPAPVKEPEPAPAPAKEKARPKQPAAAPQPAVTQPTSHNNQVEEKLRTMSRNHHYSNSGIPPHLHQNGTMPSKPFKIAAYAVIALLLILLVYIIMAGLNLEPAI